MNNILICDLPKPNGKIKGCWSEGYVVHKGHTESSLNYATYYAFQYRIIPNQNRLKKDFENFKKLLVKAGFNLTILPFPEELNQPECLHHDAVFVRDGGMMFKKYWIKANFSADRQPEAEAFAKIISRKFHKKIIQVTKGADIEFGEVIYLKTINGTYYFGGLGRSNKAGQDFVRKIIKPDHYCYIQSQGYHLDTVFTPVLSQENKIIAFIIGRDKVANESIINLKKFNLPIIYVDPIDSSGEGNDIGNFAVNTLLAPGIMCNCAKFQTKGVEERLNKMGIKRYISPLTDFRYAGGSYHCLTNEIL